MDRLDNLINAFIVYVTYRYFYYAVNNFPPKCRAKPVAICANMQMDIQWVSSNETPLLNTLLNQFAFLISLNRAASFERVISFETAFECEVGYFTASSSLTEPASILESRIRTSLGAWISSLGFNILKEKINWFTDARRTAVFKTGIVL
jgi:hypothetical protein